MARTRSSKVFFPWEQRRGLFGLVERARLRLVLSVAIVIAFVLWIRGRENHASNVRATRATLSTAWNAVLDYRADHSGKCPQNMDEVVHAGYLRDVPVDAWGHALRLTCPGRRDAAGFDLESDGPDEFRAASTVWIETKAAAQAFNFRTSQRTRRRKNMDTKEIMMNRKLRRLRRAQSVLTKRCYRTLERGVTLIEILIVLAIVGMIAGGVAVYAVPKFKDSQIKSAKISAQDLQSIADGWRADNGNDCPTPQRLKTEKQMSAGSNLNDPWGSPWKIACDGDQTTVISNGPDKKEGTPDDIHFPPEEQPTN